MHLISSIRAGRTTLLALMAASSILAGCSQPQDTGPETITSVDGLSAGDEIPQPQSKVILTVKGALSKSNGTDGVSLDLETIADMPMTEATIYEPFLKAETTFTGVLLDDFLEVIGANPQAQQIFMKALDDYSLDLSISDASESTPMLAIEENGEPIKIRNGGPARIVFLTEGAVGSNTDMWIWSVNRMKISE